MEADIATQAVGLTSSADFSILNLFLRADIIVKLVIIMLIAASIYSWAIIFEKFRMFKKINVSTMEFEEKFWRSKSAETFYNNLPSDIDDPMAMVFKESMQTVLKSRSKANLGERLTNIMSTNIEKQMSVIEKILLFGNCWSYSSFYWFIWYGLGNNEFISINCNFEKYKFSNSSPRYS